VPGKSTAGTSCAGCVGAGRGRYARESHDWLHGVGCMVWACGQLQKPKRGAKRSSAGTPKAKRAAKGKAASAVKSKAAAAAEQEASGDEAEEEQEASAEEAGSEGEEGGGRKKKKQKQAPSSSKKPAAAAAAAAAAGPASPKKGKARKPAAEAAVKQEVEGERCTAAVGWVQARTTADDTRAAHHMRWRSTPWLHTSGTGCSAAWVLEVCHHSCSTGQCFALCTSCSAQRHMYLPHPEVVAVLCFVLRVCCESRGRRRSKHRCCVFPVWCVFRSF
jgi:hypothetical protein